MSRFILMAYFDHEQDVLDATAELRRWSIEVTDVYSPHPIHGLDNALGLKPSRLTWVCFVSGVLGAAGAFWFQHWANAVDWAINVSGKPWNSMPAEVPVAFETMVLLAAFGSVAACFAVCRLFPGKRCGDATADATDSRYIVALPAECGSASETQLEDLLYGLNAQHVERRLEQ